MSMSCSPPVWAVFSVLLWFSQPTAVMNTNIDIFMSHSHWTKWCIAFRKAVDKSASCRRY